MFNMHSLVHLATRIWIRQQGRLPQVSRDAVQHLERVFPSIEYKGHRLWSAYLPHAIEILQCDQLNEPVARFRVSGRIGRYLYLDGRPKECLYWRGRTSILALVYFPGSSKIYFESLRPLAAAYAGSGKRKKSIEVLEHILEFREQTLAGNDPAWLEAQYMLATAYQADDQVNKATELFKHLIAVLEGTLGGDDPDQLESKFQLADAYFADGQIEKSIELFKHVTAVQEKSLARDHPGLLVPKYMLAVAYKDNGKPKEAVELLEHIVAVAHGVLLNDHPVQLGLRYTLAIA